MSLQRISDKNRKIEQDIMQSLFEKINLKQSVVFNSGAGAGKTYALVECLKYIVNKYGKVLTDHNQRVICITYTNVAANHIKERLGNSDIILVSTIHERVWAFINQYQRQLVELHAEKVRREINIIENDLNTNRKYSFYQTLDEREKSNFITIMFEHKDIFNKAYTLGASEFRKNMPDELSGFPNIMKNVGDFKSLVGKLYKAERLNECLTKITGGEYKSVEYNPMYNQDRLEWMRISHDTVLEYSVQMVEKYPILRQIIIDQYPYFLIDEYQDTSEDVVKIMNLLDKYGKEIHHDVFVAYFGDAVQNIYDNGVGKRLYQMHEELVEIKKQFNRRSFQEIIEVANKIRNDEIEQESIYEDSTGGTIQFYCGVQDDVEQFINYYVERWNIDKEKPLHCFLTTNQLVVQYSGFLNFYESIRKADAYSGAKYEQLNTELLSDDFVKLGRVPRLLHRLMKLYVGLKSDQTPLREILILEEMYYTDIANLRRLILSLQERKGDTLDELLQSIFKEYEETQSKQFQKLMDIIFDMGNASYLEVKKYIQENLYPNENDNEKIEEGIRCLLNTRIEELENWYRYISSEKKVGEKVIYHTYHGTKGLEFENVIIVMGKGFGKQKNYFEYFFKNYATELHDENLQLYENVRNLLYVAVTRAVKNLVILYIDDLQSIEEPVKRIFGEIRNVEELYFVAEK